MTPTTWPVLDAALQALRGVAAGVPTDRYDAPTPCLEWTVAQVLRHAVLDQRIWATAVGGAPAAEGDAFDPPRDLPDGPVALVDEALAVVPPAWAGAGSAPVSSPLPQGVLPAPTAAAACALDAAIHAWDVALATGQPSPLDDDLARGLLPAAHDILEPLRTYGVYAAVVPGASRESAVDELLRLTGRDPRWTASAS